MKPKRSHGVQYFFCAACDALHIELVDHNRKVIATVDLDADGALELTDHILDEIDAGLASGPFIHAEPEAMQ